LTAMKGFGHTLERRWEQMTQEQRALMLSGIVHDADRMDQIVRLLVDAARVSAGGLELFRERVALADVLEGVREVVERDPEHPPLEWEGEPVEALLDPARLKSTILSFAEALVWWGSGGPILVRTEKRGDGVHVSVRRRCEEPLDDAAVEDLFRPRRPGMGQGSKIGLYVAREVARAQNGRAWGTVDDGWLTFRLELPAEPDDA
ncbi:MAG TPA: hypothetical protein VF235_06755, partial [Actinomycetota bacterium]